LQVVATGVFHRRASGLARPGAAGGLGALL
jgi:hypothetical protein